MLRAYAMVDERNQTIRQEIINELENNALTVRDISRSVGIQERDVYHHLACIEKSIKHKKTNFKSRHTFLDPTPTILYIAVIVYTSCLSSFSSFIFKHRAEGDPCPTNVITGNVDSNDK
jgi:hypothetical protein